jgi:putative hemolysin
MQTNLLLQDKLETVLPYHVGSQASNIHVRMASSAFEVAQAQRLRFDVFCREMGATLRTEKPGLDFDHYDPHCRHLIAVDSLNSRVVGTYRILPPHGALASKGYYIGQHFDLSPLQALNYSLIEVGRACVHPGFRGTAVLNMLWAGLARLMRAENWHYMIGSGSISTLEGWGNAFDVYAQLKEQYAVPKQWHLESLKPVQMPTLVSRGKATVPPLLRAYMQMGAWVAGEPYVDHDFNCIDVPVLLQFDRLTPRFERRFFGETSLVAS